MRRLFGKRGRRGRHRKRLVFGSLRGEVRQAGGLHLRRKRVKSWGDSEAQRGTARHFAASARSRSAGSPYLKARAKPGSHVRTPEAPRTLLRKKAPNQGKALA